MMNIYGNPSKSPMCDYFLIMHNKEKLKLIKHNLGAVLVSLRKIIETGFNNLILNFEDISFIGAYNPIVTKTVMDYNSVSDRVKFQFFNVNEICGFSTIQIEYLKIIANLCRKKDVQLYLIFTPVSGLYSETVPEKFRNAYDNEISLNGFNLLDFRSFKLKNDFYLKDGEHLAKIGAEYFTSYFTNKFCKKDTTSLP
jgi:hypothetical protein